MPKLDRYILREMVGPFVFGVGAFLIVLVSIDLLYDALRLIVRQGYPAGPVARIFLYRMPQTITLTLPMATMFGALMAIGRLSSDGEVEAMRAGGVSFLRLAAPVLMAGLLISGLSLALNEGVVPPANAASSRLMRELAQETVAGQHYLVLQLPNDEFPKILLVAERFDSETNTLSNVWIGEFRAGRYPEQYEFETGEWQGSKIIGHNVVHRTYAADGTFREESARRWEYEIGKAPWQVESMSKDPEEMTLAELRRDIGRTRLLPPPARKQLPQLVGYYNMRLALPWSALGFALIAAPLALRPKRTTTGVGLGISLAIILAYYIIFNTLRVVGEQGALPPALAAWLPNLILYGVALGLIIDASR